MTLSPLAAAEVVSIFFSSRAGSFHRRASSQRRTYFFQQTQTGRLEWLFVLDEKNLVLSLSFQPLSVELLVDPVIACWYSTFGARPLVKFIGIGCEATIEV